MAANEAGGYPNFEAEDSGAESDATDTEEAVVEEEAEDPTTAVNVVGTESDADTGIGVGGTIEVDIDIEEDETEEEAKKREEEEKERAEEDARDSASVTKAFYDYLKPGDHPKIDPGTGLPVSLKDLRLPFKEEDLIKAIQDGNRCLLCTHPTYPLVILIHTLFFVGGELFGFTHPVGYGTGDSNERQGSVVSIPIDLTWRPIITSDQVRDPDSEAVFPSGVNC